MDMLPEPAAPTSHGRTFGGNRAFHNFFNDFSHIQDPNLRRRLALSEIDKVPFGFYHVRAVLVAGIGFFLDSYDIFAINLITTLLGVVFWHGPPEKAVNGYGGNYGTLPTPVSQALKASTSAGIVVGQIMFGWLADVFGRRRMYGVELAIIVVATFGCTLVAPSQAMSFTGLMAFWRVMMGVGIGGDYPLSSVITSEFAPTRWRGAMMSAVFSMQGIGQLVAALVALIVTVSFKEAYHGAANVGGCDVACQIAADRSWRLIVGVGALPACFALYYRITIPETPRYTFEVARDVEKADADIKAYMASKAEGEVDEVQQARMKKVASPALNVPSASWPDLYSYFGQWKNARMLIGTTMSWFFLDLAFYGLGLNNTIVLHAIGYATGDTLYEQLLNNAIGTIILAILGFIALTIVFSVLGFYHHHLNQSAMLALYFFFNWGPNTTTFIVPAECFPTRYRSSGHGLSAAMGKIGAIIAQVISIPLLSKDSPVDCKGSECSPWLDRLMQIFALFMLCGTFVSFLIPETKGLTLEELAGEQPTSYNAGRNGSFIVAPQRWWNPFKGGQPAGFCYPHFKRGARNPRVGIMTSPEMAAQQQQQQQQHQEAHDYHSRKAGNSRSGKSSRRRGGSNDTAGYEMSSTSSTTGIVPPSSGTLVREDGDTSGAHGGLLPGWGVGWGRIDRGGNPTSVENIKLQDVGRLLR
ncbi:major facilitator superfamily domain-containing protein [Apiospora rasikravindrae]|uniref:Major facilitator superfamily domain-containing protein n=1 Tax=Apiospora rasikravindrae TaxID=990691 RepID=A0ABR1TZC9_9PEZI